MPRLTGAARVAARDRAGALKYGRSLTYEQVAAEMGLSRSTVAHLLLDHRRLRDKVGVLKYERGLTHEQIAAELELSQSHVVRLLEEYRQARGGKMPSAGESRIDPGLATQQGDGVLLPQKKRKPAVRVLLRAAVYDIEVTDFGTEGWGGRMILCCVLPLESDTVKTIGIRFDERGDDRRVLREIGEELAKYDILIGHNIASFDMNWLNSRFMFYGMPPMKTHLYFDTYQVAKGLGIKTRKSLGNLLDYFNLDGEKTSVYRTSWLKVLSPHKWEFEEGYKDIAYHCEQDVIGNRNLFDVMYPYALANGRVSPFKLSKMRNGTWAERAV